MHPTRRPKRARTMTLLRSIVPALLLAALGCACTGDSPRTPAERIYRSGTIERHADGSVAKAKLRGVETVAGLPCRDWIRFHPDGSLRGCRLDRETEVLGHRLPARSWLWFAEGGRLETAWLAEGRELGGVPCRGGGKISTSFHPDGRVASTFLSTDATFDGVPCAASLLAPVRFHPDGRLAACRLAADWEHGATRHPRGSDLVFDERGTPRREF